MNGPQMDIARVSSKNEEAHLTCRDRKISSRKHLKTAALLAACINAGLNDGLIGPTLADLQMVLDNNAEQVSVVFTWRALLAVAGSLASSRLQERWSHPVLIGVVLLLQGIAGAATPWIPDVLLMGAVSGIAAFFTGAAVTGIYCYTYHIWQHHSKPMIRAIRLFYTLGLASAPLVTTAFLYRPPRGPDGKRLDILVNDEVITMSPRIENSTAERPEPVGFETDVQYAYAIVGGLSVFMSVCFFALTNECDAKAEHAKRRTSIVTSYKRSTKLFSASSAHYSHKYSAITATTTGTNGDLDFTSSSCHVLSVMFSFMVFTAVFGGLEVSFIGLLLTFNFNFLGWTKTTSLIMISVHQLCRASFSLMFSFLSKYIKERSILAFDMFLLIATTVFMFLTANPENPWTMWICAVTLALTDSNIYNILLSWLGSHMKNLDSLPTLFSVSFSVGVMILPYLTAHLLDTFGYLAYPGVLLGCSIVCALTFTCLYFLVWCKYEMIEDNQEITPLLQSHAHI